MTLQLQVFFLSPCSRRTLGALIEEIPASDVAAHHNKMSTGLANFFQLTTQAMQTPRVVGALQKPVAAYHNSSPALFSDELLCPYCGPLATTAAQFSE